MYAGLSQYCPQVSIFIRSLSHSTMSNLHWCGFNLGRFGHQQSENKSETVTNFQKATTNGPVEWLATTNAPVEWLATTNGPVEWLNGI